MDAATGGIRNHVESSSSGFRRQASPPSSPALRRGDMLGGRSRSQRRDRVRFPRTSVRFPQNPFYPISRCALRAARKPLPKTKKPSAPATGTEGFSDHKSRNRQQPSCAKGCPAQRGGSSSGFRHPTYSRVFPPTQGSDGSGFVAGYSGATASESHGLPFAFPLFR